MLSQFIINNSSYLVIQFVSWKMKYLPMQRVIPKLLASPLLNGLHYPKILIQLKKSGEKSKTSFVEWRKD